VQNLHFISIALIALAASAVLCGSAGAVSIGAEPHITSGMNAPSCTAPCECMSETAAIQRWGADGWERCSKTVCGQSADAMVQYYCIHQSGSSVATGAAPAQAPGPAGAAPAAGVTRKSPASLVNSIAVLGLAIWAGAYRIRK